MNLLTLIQEFTTRTGLPKPSFVIGNTDPQVLQLLSLLNEVIEELMEKDWTALTQEATFTTIAAEDQGAIATLAPNGFKWVLQDTIYNRTLRLPIFGPLGAAQWQAAKALPSAGPFNEYRIVRKRLLFDPPATAGHTCAFEYASKYCILADDTTTYKEYPTADTDTFLLDDTLFLAGLRWKWKYEKGLDYAEEFRRYEELVNNTKGRDGTKPLLALDGSSRLPAPGIFVPFGSWNLP